ncbi:MAG TPA: AAA family ATPase [Candidatus Limnocylindrales bacterium]|nr:AAA family ATPase [Candidatus Limnocylindrales bacterium]
MPRPTIPIFLPAAERDAVAAELARAGFDPLPVDRPAELEELLAVRREVSVAILDGETDFDAALDLYAVLRADGRAIPALLVVSPRALDRIMAEGAGAGADDEYLTRPYSAESVRWRVEAMCIRSQTLEDSGGGPIIETGPFEFEAWARRGTIVAVFNPKGGVGKTTVATNLASALRVRKDQRVLLVDADTVTGHVVTSLALEQVRTVADAWREELDGAPAESLAQIAAEHPSGLRVVALTDSPLETDLLEPDRVARAIGSARRGFDFVVVDLHPSYSHLNQALFGVADRILVPVTPDVPALRAAIQFREVAGELGVRDRLAMIVNRANSGVSVEDMERTTGMPALAQIRSGGMLFVRAANEGRTVIERYPKEKVTEDFVALAERLLGQTRASPQPAPQLLRLLRRPRQAVSA